MDELLEGGGGIGGVFELALEELGLGDGTADLGDDENASFIGEFLGTNGFCEVEGKDSIEFSDWSEGPFDGEIDGGKFVKDINGKGEGGKGDQKDF